MRRRSAVLFPLILIFFSLSTLPGQAQGEAWQVQILESDAEHLLLELTLPAFEIETVSHEGVQYQRLTVDGWSRWGQPGQPQLPFYNVPLGLPWPGEPQISILETESELLAGYHLYPAPDLASGGPPDRPEIVEVFAYDAAAYQADTVYPGPLTEVAEHGFLRDQPLLQLRLYPFQYNPQRQELRFYRRLRVLITFPAAPPEPSQAGAEPPPLAFEKILRRTLVNYDDLPKPSTPPDKKTPASGATYLIITHPDFFNAVQGLKTYRQSQGESVIVAKTDDIYDQYNGGLKSAEAIRDYLADAYNNWSPKPVYVLLVGDASADPNKLPDLLPAHYDPVVLFGDAPNDTWYSKVNGNDIYPDLIVGRIPARSSSEVTTVVNKIIAYESSPPAGNWARRAVLVADNDNDDTFRQDMEAVANLLPGGLEPIKIYDYDPNNTVEEQIGPGALIFAYSGHGSSTSWGSWNGQNIYKQSKISNMANGNKLPFMTVANCSNGYFANPNKPRVLAEEFLLIQNKGGIASLAPSSFAFPTVNTPLLVELYETIFVDNDLILGSAVTSARLQAYLANDYLPLTLFEVFSYFGDPAVELDLPATLELTGQDSPDPVVMGQEITYSLEYTVSGAVVAPELTLVNTLPAQTTYQSASPPPSSINGQVLTWNLGDVSGSPPSNRTVEITARANTTGLAHGQQVTNEATLADYFGENGTVQLTTTVLDAPISGLSATNDGPTFLTFPTTFTATTQAGTNVVYTWDFDDGSPPQQGASVQHTYGAIGTYVVQVAAANGVSSDSTTTNVKVRDIPPQASFTSSTPDKIGQTSSFQSTSIGTNLIYEWNFGDGSVPVSGQLPSVTHDYGMTGTYTVVLTATNSEGSSTSSRAMDILDRVISPVASFVSSSPDRLTETTTFTNTSQDGADEPGNLTYQWDFGDGTHSDLQHPDHIFTAIGAHTVWLIVTNSVGSDVFSATVTITPAPNTIRLPVIFKPVP